jgi:hypothetical protein
MMNPTSHESADLRFNLNSSDSKTSRRLPLAKPPRAIKLWSTVCLIGSRGRSPKPLLWSTTAPVLLGLILVSTSGLQAQVKTVKDDADQGSVRISPTDDSSATDGKSSFSKFVSLTGKVFSAVFHPGSKDSSNRSIVAIGRVIAYDQLAPLASITVAPQSQPLVVRIQQRVKGREDSDYVKVLFNFGINEEPAPEKLFDGKSIWRFTLKRDQKCDSTLTEMNFTSRKSGDLPVSRLNFVNETERPDSSVILPCYELRPAKLALADGAVKTTRVLKLEADGEEMKTDYKVFLSAYGQEFKARLNNEGFVLPTELQHAETIDVKIVIRKEHLDFSQVHISKFDEEWIIGIDHKPFSEELSERRDVSKVGVIYYITFQSKGGLDTRLLAWPNVENASTEKLGMKHVRNTTMPTKNAITRKAAQRCQYWQSKVDETLSSSQRDVDHTDLENILEAVECLLQMEGNKHPARFSGATQFYVSQLFEPAKADVAALYYISYLYTQNWEHADAIALRSNDGAINSAQDIEIAYQSYRRWFAQVKAVGLEKARQMNLQPLKDTNIRWY